MGRRKVFSDDYHSQSVRLDQDDADYIQHKGRGASFNEALRNCVKLLRDMEAEGLAEIRGYFQPNEWKFLANVLKGDEQPIASKNELCRRVMRIRLLVVLTSYFGIEPAKIVDKIQALNACHVTAITQRIFDYWNNGEPQGVDINDWSRY